MVTREELGRACVSPGNEDGGNFEDVGSQPRCDQSTNELLCWNQDLATEVPALLL